MCDDVRVVLDRRNRLVPSQCDIVDKVQSLLCRSTYNCVGCDGTTGLPKS